MPTVHFLPLLTDPERLPDLEEHRARVRKTPTGASLSALVREVIPLNSKQSLIVEKIPSDALGRASYPYDSARRDQTLLYIGGGGGVGKSQIIKAIIAGMDLMDRKQEVITMAPTGAAADIIGGNTYHTSLGISLNRSRNTTMGFVRRMGK